MPRIKTTAPAQSKEKFQRSQQLPDYLMRYVPMWQTPKWVEAEGWRRVVANQPLCEVCMERLNNQMISFDWKIEPRDANKRQEYKEDIDYYTKFFQNTGNYDYADLVEWVLQDYLTLPFGAGAEIGREGDSPDGKVLWVEPLDGGTLWPTLNADFPVGQQIPNSSLTSVYFPYYAINRLYMTPRTEIMRKGWGIAPPEKIYLALELLNRGDRYYANLLLDTPPVGILDLGDIAEDSAISWLKSWKEMLGGIDPFKVPVLYEHEKPASFIAFQKSPTELMFDKATVKYAAILASGYGLTLGDIGFSTVGNGGETLAGSIRQERQTRKSGVAKAKARLKLFFDRMLPEYLQWSFIDLDDEVSVAVGRARLANATAWNVLLDKGIFTPDEARQQTIADGLISISVPEEVDLEKIVEFKKKLNPLGEAGGNERQGLLGKPIAPSQGGYGEKKSQVLDIALENPEFNSVYTELEAKWETMSEASKNDAVKELQDFLSSVQSDAIASDVLEDAIENLA